MKLCQVFEAKYAGSGLYHVAMFDIVRRHEPKNQDLGAYSTLDKAARAAHDWFLQNEDRTGIKMLGPFKDFDKNNISDMGTNSKGDKLWEYSPFALEQDSYLALFIKKDSSLDFRDIWPDGNIP
jgi:hypothetical protein